MEEAFRTLSQIMNRQLKDDRISEENRFGRATFLPLSNMSGRGGISQREVLREEGVIGTADTLVQAEAQYSGLVQYLLGRVLVVDHIDHAIAIGKNTGTAFVWLPLKENP